MPVTAKKEILALENKYWKSLRENDMATADKLTNDPCILTGPMGRRGLIRQASEK